jgi:hypothetical protein
MGAHGVVLTDFMPKEKQHRYQGFHGLRGVQPPPSTAAMVKTSLMANNRIRRCLRSTKFSFAPGNVGKPR